MSGKITRKELSPILNSELDSINMQLSDIVCNVKTFGAKGDGGNIYIDVDNLFNATRAIYGSATVTMPNKVTFI